LYHNLKKAFLTEVFMLFAELLQDDTCCYALLAYGGWALFGQQAIDNVLSTPIGQAAYSLATYLF